MSNLEMGAGDVVAMTSCEVVHDTADGGWLRARFHAKRGERMYFLVLSGPVKTEADIVAELAALGFHRSE